MIKSQDAAQTQARNDHDGAAFRGRVGRGRRLGAGGAAVIQTGEGTREEEEEERQRQAVADEGRRHGRRSQTS